jgi:NADH-quinone oxidoreductase subunit M
MNAVGLMRSPLAATLPTWLDFLTLLPLLGAFILLFQPRMGHRLARQVALIVAGITALGTIPLFLLFEPSADGPQFAWIGGDGRPGLAWISIPGSGGIRWALGLDGISLWLYVLTTVLVLPAILASWESVKERSAGYYAMILSLETGLLGLFASLDVVLFYIFFEFTLIPLFFLIGLYGGPERRRASVTFFLYTLAGSLLTLVGVISLVLVNQAQSPSRELTFSIPELTQSLASLPWAEWTRDATRSWTSPQALIFLLLLAGFAIKVPLIPFHTWLPLAHVEAPTSGSILLAGVLLKVGGYGLIRFNLGMTPHGAEFFAPLMMVVCVIGIIYGALTALAQTDVKRLVAYSSVSHMGFVCLGLFALNRTGIAAAVIQMVNHGLTTGALFACVGILYERYHTREMSMMGGVWQRFPLVAFFFIVSALGSAALPGLNGFVGEFPILLAAFVRDPWIGVLAATGMVLGAWYLLLMLRRVVFGPLHEPGDDDHNIREGGSGHGPSHSHSPVPIGWHEVASLSMLIVGIVGIGIYPTPVTERIQPAVDSLRVVQEVPPSGRFARVGSGSEGSAEDHELVAAQVQVPVESGGPLLSVRSPAGGSGSDTAMRERAR